MIQAFHNLVQENLKEGIIVAEVGTYDGATTRGVAPLVKQVNGKYIAVDWFKGNPTAAGEHSFDEGKHDSVLEIFKNSIKETDCEDIVEIYDMTSLEAASKLKDKSLDICFIDADHRYEFIKQDIIAYLPKIKKGGILCGHDLEKDHIDSVDQFTEEDLLVDCGRFGHAGVIKAVYETIGFDKITFLGDNVWMTVI